MKRLDHSASVGGDLLHPAERGTEGGTRWGPAVAALWEIEGATQQPEPTPTPTPEPTPERSDDNDGECDGTLTLAGVLKAQEDFRAGRITEEDLTDILACWDEQRGL